MLWLLRRHGTALIAATIACAAAHTARAESRPADTCGRAAFRVIIDVGHTAKVPGATSARGVSEFVFNLNLAKRIEQQLLGAGFRRSVLLITEGPSAKGLADRVKRAKDLAADLFLSIHHDSVPDQLLEKWEFEGEERSFSDRFSGHSIFISQDNIDYAGSLLFARLLGGQLRKRGMKYTPHYTDSIMGYRKRLLIDAQAGVYHYDQLIVLRGTDMPAVLLEAGSIIKAATSADRKLVTGVNVFDVFEGASVGENKKSVAIEVQIQPVDKTLTDEDFEALTAKIVGNVEKSTGGVLRA